MSRRLALILAVVASLSAASVLVWRAAVAHERKTALELAKRGNFQDAEPALRNALAASPHDVEVLRVLANGYVKHQRKAEADDCLTRWLAVAPREPEALQLRVQLYRELGQFDKALIDVDRLLESDPQSLALGRKRIAVLFGASRFAEAEEACQRWLKTNPEDIGLRRTLAEIKRSRGDLADAGAMFDAILSKAPSDTGALMSRAQLHVSQDEPDKAIPLLRKIVKGDPNRQRAGRYYLALALNRVGQKEEAERVMEELRRMQEALMLKEDSDGQPDNLPLQLRAARAHFENNDLQRTVNVLMHILNRDPDHGAAHALMADVLDKQGRFDQAVEHRRRAKDKS